MAENILARYGIKEVADVTFYEVEVVNGMETPGAPVLYLETLKVSTVEQTAENVSARGGKGNPELIVWDYGKEITVTLEDALFSAKSMAIMFGSLDKDKKVKFGDSVNILKTVPIAALTESSGAYYAELNGTKVAVAGGTYYDAMGSSMGSTYDSSAAYVTFVVSTSEQAVIEVSAATFPGNYYVTGDTYARNESTGKDEFFQFIIPKAKVQSEVTLTMEAEGDPSTFSMSLRVLRPADGKMMKLVKYDLAANS